MKRKILYVVAAVVGLGVIASLSNSGNDSPAASSQPLTNQVVETPFVPPTERPMITLEPKWYPEGYSLSLDSGVAFKWLKRPEYECDYGDCNGLEAITKEGCDSSLYIEVSILDKNGTSIGFSNDMTGHLDAMQKAQMIFHIFEDNADKIRITEVRCF